MENFESAFRELTMEEINEVSGGVKAKCGCYASMGPDGSFSIDCHCTGDF